MIVGFTGTRKGMTDAQRASLNRWIILTPAGRGEDWFFHHGDCLGADDEAHKVAEAHGAKIIIHPPSNPAMQAFCKPYERKMPPCHYLVRNMNIVKACDVLVAAPEGAERMRSGTWSTIRYAKKVGKPIVLLTPDGSTIECG